jgi:hypothetical protein
LGSRGAAYGVDAEGLVKHARVALQLERRQREAKPG